MTAKKTKTCRRPGCKKTAAATYCSLDCTYADRTRVRGRPTALCITGCGTTLHRSNTSGRCRACDDEHKKTRKKPPPTCRVCGRERDKRGKYGLCGQCERARRPAAAAANAPTDSFTDNGDTGVISQRSTTEVRSLEDLIRVCRIDTTVWEVERWVCNKWEMGYKDKDSDAHAIPLFQIKAWLRRISGQTRTLQALEKALVADIRAEVTKAAPDRGAARRRYVKTGWLFEFIPFDLHMGKYAWSEETVTNYDTDIAEDLFNASLDFLLGRAMKVSDGKLDRVLCVFGSDVSHIDTKHAQTTAGTPLDVDTRYVRVYRRISAIHRRAVDILRGIAPVDVKIVPGNHDELTSFHLGEILAARYEGLPHITVDNGPRLRKYYDYGVNLFGFTHGGSEKVSELPLTMAREQPKLWARCPSREWHIGHKHISEKFEARSTPGCIEQDLVSDKGVRIRRLTSLSGHDAWHTKHAYMDRRACEAFVFHQTAGFTDHLSFNVDHFTGKALSR